jgi:hypothetical protein
VDGGVSERSEAITGRCVDIGTLADTSCHKKDSWRQRATANIASSGLLAFLCLLLRHYADVHGETGARLATSCTETTGPSYFCSTTSIWSTSSNTMLNRDFSPTTGPVTRRALRQSAWRPGLRAGHARCARSRPNWWRRCACRRGRTPRW